MRTEFPRPVRKMFDEMSIVIVSPMFYPEGKWAQCTVNAVAHAWHHGLRVWEMGITEKQVVHWARNSLARIVKDVLNPITGEKYTHILWLDSDEVFGRDLIVELAKNFMHEGVDVVSGIYYSRTGKPMPNVFVKEDCPGDEFRHYNLLAHPEGLCEVDGFGFGAVMMRRDVLERFPEPWFQFHGAGEDVWFCVKAKKAGIRLWIDGSVYLGHIGEPPIITKADFLRHMEEHKEEYADKVQIQLKTV